MQVGTVRTAQLHVTLKDLCTQETLMTRFSCSLTVLMPIFAAFELSKRSLLSMLPSVASCESLFLQGTVLCACFFFFFDSGGVNELHSQVRLVLLVVAGHVG